MFQARDLSIDLVFEESKSISHDPIKTPPLFIEGLKISRGFVIICGAE